VLRNLAAFAMTNSSMTAAMPRAFQMVSLSNRTRCEGVIGKPSTSPPSFWAAVGRVENGAAAVEFAMLAPVLMMVLLGTVQFGLVLNNDVELINGARASVRQLAISRSSTTPYTNAKSAITSSAPDLTGSSITLTFTVNGTACASDSACITALSTAAGTSASVSASYPCNLTIFGVNYASGCTLRSTTTEIVE
jgi:Flp pilus assembly protein TadG